MVHLPYEVVAAEPYLETVSLLSYQVTFCGSKWDNIRGNALHLFTNVRIDKSS